MDHLDETVAAYTATLKHALLEYLSLMAERQSAGPGDAFEYALWRDFYMQRSFVLVSAADADDLKDLVERAQMWFSGNLQTGCFDLIPLR